MWPKLVFKRQAIASLQLCIHKIQPMRLPHLGHVIKIDYQNLRFPIALRITWPKCVNVIGQKFCVFSKTTNLFCLQAISERFIKIMHSKISTNEIAVFRSCDENWPIRVLQFRNLPDYRNFGFLTVLKITWFKYGDLIGEIFGIFSKQRISFVYKR